MQAARFAFGTNWALLLAIGCASTWGCSDDQQAVSSGAGSSGAAGRASTAGRGGGGSSSAGAAATQGSDAGSDAGGAGGSADESADAGASGAGPTREIPDFNGCTSEAYVDQRSPNASRTVAIAASGLTFTPKCLLISAGQSVRWEGSLSAHPLAPGNQDHPDAGSPNNPILATTSGSSVEFAFAEPGTFPYQCEVHSFGDGKGMAGVVHVLP